MEPQSGGLTVDLHGVAKTYGRKVHALQGIEMQVHPGEIFGLLGPNGAGKSTLVKVMMTVVRATKAAGTILGMPIGHKPTLARVGYLPENHRFPPYLTGRQALEYFAAMSRVSRPVRKARAIALLETVGLKDWGKAKIGTYSKGMQQRLGLAQAFINDPDLIILDEPTDGLDPVGRREIRDVLNAFRDRGKTIFLNSHLLGELERVCDRMAILVAGKVVRQGTLAELTAGGRCYEIVVEAPKGTFLTETLRQAVPCALSTDAPGTSGSKPPPLSRSGTPVPPIEKGTLPSGLGVELEGNLLRIDTSKPDEVQSIIDMLREMQLVIQSVNCVAQSLEDYFIATVSDAKSIAPPVLPGTEGRS